MCWIRERDVQGLELTCKIVAELGMEILECKTLGVISMGYYHLSKGLWSLLWAHMDVISKISNFLHTGK